MPGIDLINAWAVLAELGSEMSVFSSPRHTAAWAGLYPGNHESGDKRSVTEFPKGNRGLRWALYQAASAVTPEEELLHRGIFDYKADKHGARKAIATTTHRLLIIAFCIRRDGISRARRHLLRPPERTRNPSCADSSDSSWKSSSSPPPSSQPPHNGPLRRNRAGPVNASEVRSLVNRGSTNQMFSKEMV
jgi:hypothetical protein